MIPYADENWHGAGLAVIVMAIGGANGVPRRTHCCNIAEIIARHEGRAVLNKFFFPASDKFITS